MLYDINFGNCKKRITFSVKMSDTNDVESLLKKLNINSFDDMPKLDKLDSCIKEIVQTQIDELQCNYDLYENDAKYKNALISNINTVLSSYGHFITDLVIGV